MSTNPCRRSALRTLNRAFTLVEVLAVLAMIAVLAVAASPSFVKLMRERRVNRAAMNLVDFLRTGRTLAIGRGQPILVWWSAPGQLPPTHPGGTGYIEIDEPVIISNAAARNCSTTLWHTPAAQAVNSFDLQNGKYDYAWVNFYDQNDPTHTTAVNFAEICFSNTGRMYMRTGSGGNANGVAFAPVVGVPSFAVFNIDTNPGKNQGTARWVYVPPNGMARLQL